MMKDDVRPFQIEVHGGVLTDLRRRLEQTRWPSAVDSANWSAGTDFAYLKELVTYWQRTFDWGKQEEELNQFSHFRTEVEGIGIHFIHERGKGPTGVDISPQWKSQNC